MCYQETLNRDLHKANNETIGLSHCGYFIVHNDLKIIVLLQFTAV